MKVSGSSEPPGGHLIGLSAMLAGVIFVPILVGLLLDSALHTRILFFFVGLVVGIASAGALVYVRLLRSL